MSKNRVPFQSIQGIIRRCMSRSSLTNSHDEKKLVVSTSKLLNDSVTPLGSLTPETLKEFDGMFRIWTKKGTQESVNRSIGLFERLIVEEERKPPGKGNRSVQLLHTKMLYDLLDNWRRCWIKRNMKDYTPSEMLSRIENYTLRSPSLKLNTKMYTSIMQATRYHIDPAASATFTKSILEKMKKMSISGNRNVKPNTMSYNTTIHAHANSGNAKEAEALLKEMQQAYANGDSAVKPNLKSFNMVLMAWAKSRDIHAAKNAESLLLNMHELCNSRFPDVKPNAISYNTVLNCWAKSKQKGCGQHAEDLFREMERRYNSGEKDLQPDVISYNALINAYCNDGNAKQAEKILKEMKEASTKREENLVEPNWQTFSMVLMALSRSGEVSAAQRAEAILKQMQEMYNAGVRDMKPNLFSYTAVMRCWAKSRQKESGERAEKLLHDMEKKFDSGEKYLKPDTIAYSTVIDAYAQVGNAKKAEEVLEKMYETYTNGNASVKPNSRCFNTVLTAWSRSNDANAAKRAEKILEQMQKLSDSGVLDVKPNVVSYTALLGCWTKSTKAGAGARAASMLYEMEQKGVEPDQRFYSHAIHACARIGDTQRAESLLKRMYASYKEGKSRVCPDVRCFNSVLNAWSRSNEANAAERATTILENMLALNKSGALDATPNVYTYTAVMNCFAKAGQTKFAERAENILRLMETPGDAYSRPDRIAYSTVIHAHARAGDAIKAGAILGEMITSYESGNVDIKPTIGCFNTVLMAWSKSGYANAPEKAEGILEQMRVLAAAGALDVKPDIVSYNTILNCWAKAGNQGSCERAENLLREMETVSKSGDTNVKPDAISYSTVINAYASIGNTQKSGELLEEMCDSYTGGNVHLKPDLQLFNKFLTACSRSEDISNLGDRVDATLTRMQKIGIEPDLFTYKMALVCWEKSTGDRSPNRIQEIRMKIDEISVGEVKREMMPAEVEVPLKKHPTML